jgi:hypothetical protein
MDGNALLGQFLGAAQTFATPFAQSLVYGKPQATEVALTRERADMEQLNGSGPSNPDLAVSQSSKSLFDFLYGSPGARGTAGTGGSNMPLILLAIVGILAVIFMVRR